jgi:hypothetical protein
LKTRGGVLRGLGMIALLAACAKGAAPPSADARQAGFPDVGGHTVMLLPVQRVVPTLALPAQADTLVRPASLSAESLQELEAELSYWLPEQATRVKWVLPDAVERAVSRSPTLEVRVRDLPVRDFQVASVRTVGDPLYGDLRRISLVNDARLALLPIGAVWIAETGGLWRVHLAATLIDTFGGNVLWQGVVAGDAVERNASAGIASVARQLAARIPR